MWDRLLLAMDQYESGQAALTFTAGLAAATGTDVRIIHIRELSRLARRLSSRRPRPGARR
jgi:hypothetical protein